MIRRLPHALAFALWLAVAMMLTYWALIFTSRRQPVERLEPVPPGDAVMRSQPVDTSAIAALLGGSGKVMDGDVKLLGIIAEGRAGKGVAVIAYQGGSVQTIKAGEEVAAGVTLLEVSAQGVTLLQGGVRRSVAMPDPSSAESRPAPVQPPANVLKPR